MALPTGGTHTKGAAIRSFLSWYERSGDRARLVGALEVVPPEHRGLLDPSREALGVLPSVWYPSPLVHALVDGVTAGLSEDELSRLAHEGAQVIIRESLNGVYKMLFALLVNPERYAKNAHRIWKMFHDSGTTDIAILGPREQRARISGWRGHHPFICRLNRASTAELYRAMKCKNVVLSDEKCVTRGQDVCVSRIVWD
jgi:hypothetical protein